MKMKMFCAPEGAASSSCIPEEEAAPPPDRRTASPKPEAKLAAGAMVPAAGYQSSDEGKAT